MKKGRLFKGLVLAMAMVMLLSVTAFAGSSVSWSTDGGASAHGSCGMFSASTSVSSPMYVAASFTTVYLNQYAFYRETGDSASNMGTSVTASTSTPSDYAAHDSTSASHTAGSTSRETSY